MEAVIAVVLLGALATALIVLVSLAINATIRRKYLHRERIAALEKGLPLPDELLLEPTPNGRPQGNHGTAVAGIVWTGVGLGLLTSSTAALGEPSFGSEFRQFIAFLRLWAWPALFVGTGLLVYAWLIRDRGGKPS
jgi:hypothetical protein